MRIIVTGATGFLGGRLVEQLVALQHVSHIIATGRKFSSDNRITNNKIEYILGDLTNETFVQELMAYEVDVIVNCASKSSPWGTHEEFQSANVLSQRLLLKYFQGDKFIYISSPSIYFAFEDKLNIKEEDALPLQPVNEYARTKILAENILRESGKKFIILRPRALVGRGDTVIMPRLIKAHKEGRLRMIGSGKNRVDLTSVANMTLAIEKAIFAPDLSWNEDYNITNGSPVSLWKSINMVLRELDLQEVSARAPFFLVRLIARLMEWGARTSEPTLTQYSAGVLAFSFTMDITKAREKLGYEPKQSLDASIREFAEWHKNNGS